MACGTTQRARRPSLMLGCHFQTLQNTVSGIQEPSIQRLCSKVVSLLLLCRYQHRVPMQLLRASFRSTPCVLATPHCLLAPDCKTDADLIGLGYMQFLGWHKAARERVSIGYFPPGYAKTLFGRNASRWYSGQLPKPYYWSLQIHRQHNRGARV